MENFGSLCPTGRELGGGWFVLERGLGLFRCAVFGGLQVDGPEHRNERKKEVCSRVFLLISCAHAFATKARSRITVSTQTNLRLPRLTWPDRTGRTDGYRLCRNRSGTQADLRSNSWMGIKSRDLEDQGGAKCDEGMEWRKKQMYEFTAGTTFPGNLWLPIMIIQGREK